jgi:AraC-like DNA-binding protein
MNAVAKSSPARANRDADGHLSASAHLQAEHWLTTTLNPRQQLDAFQERISSAYSPWNLKAVSKDRYFAEVWRYQLGEYALSRVTCDPMTGTQVTKEGRTGIAPYFCLMFLDQGAVTLRQGRYETHIPQNGIAIYDSTRPCSVSAPIRFTQVSLTIPLATGMTIMPGIQDLCGTSIDGSSGCGHILLGHLRQLHQAIAEVPVEHQANILRATVELFAATFQPESDFRGATSYKRALLARIQQYIVDNLHRTDLSPSSVARHFKISSRYLHRLFEEFDITAGCWIRKRRLLAAQHDLIGSSGARALAITQIALRRGFSGSSHFSRTFKAEFGMSPREFRQATMNREKN